eukprot:TRINITY_DN9503_c0_g1_i1.p1 TRINITY_DN9503_c0_g1~~TRINITY_DN9503_c0_g1_i1.p1  ORF type:complete len:342 (-),score=61.62 TRINITY_DN9503_c0_g1_i1:139-1020(-)
MRTVESFKCNNEIMIKQSWKCNFSAMLKVSWNPDLCVFSVLYEKDGEQRTKVYFVKPQDKKSIIKYWDKVKPNNVIFSPGRPSKSKSKSRVKVLKSPVPKMSDKENSNPNILSPVPMSTGSSNPSLPSASNSSPSVHFKLKRGFDKERFWRLSQQKKFGLLDLHVGVSDKGIRALSADNHTQEKWMVPLESILSLKVESKTILNLKFEKENGTTSAKQLHAHPATISDLMGYYSHFTEGTSSDNAVVVKQKSQSRLKRFTSTPQLPSVKKSVSSPSPAPSPNASGTKEWWELD